MTDPELAGLAMQALNMAKRDIERKKEFGMLIASWHQGEGLHRMRQVEQLIEEKLGPRWLDSGRSKDAAFRVLRVAVTMSPPDGLVMVTGGNQFLPTKAMLALPIEEQHKMLDTNHDRHHQLVAEGFLTIRDTLQAIAQTPERVCLCVQAKGEERLDKPHFWDQREFRGRMKMYQLEPEDLI